jgi:hypothetical protein
VSEEQMYNLVKECGLDWHRGFMPLFDGDPTNRYVVLIEAVMQYAYADAAKVCRELDDAPFADIEQPTPHDCADAIEALAKGAT